jgi:hypothetical protein
VGRERRGAWVNHLDGQLSKRPKTKAVPDLIRRQRALASTMNKFGGQQLVLGRSDCALLVRHHLVKMGHRRLPKPGPYSTPNGVRQVLKGWGFKDLEQLFDSLLPRIAPAYMLPGDIALVQPEQGAPAWQVGTVVISVGRKFLGWHPDHPILAVCEPLVEQPFLAAWRA